MELVIDPDQVGILGFPALSWHTGGIRASDSRDMAWRLDYPHLGLWRAGGVFLRVNPN
jgi:hypothetical protein